MDICTAGSLDMNFILDLYQSAFPEEERKPFSLIERKAVMGEMEILLIKEERKPIGFAIVAFGDRLVLLDYFAISEKWRGMGYGSAALELILALYSDRQFFLEVEVPDQICRGEEDDPQKHQAGIAFRKRRRNFYLKNGMLTTGIFLDMYGVKMELLSSMPGLTFEKCEPLYRSLVGPSYHSVIRQIRADD